MSHAIVLEIISKIVGFKGCKVVKELKDLNSNILPSTYLLYRYFDGVS